MHDRSITFNDVIEQLKAGEVADDLAKVQRRMRFIPSRDQQFAPSEFEGFSITNSEIARFRKALNVNVIGGNPGDKNKLLCNVLQLDKPVTDRLAKVNMLLKLGASPNAFDNRAWNLATKMYKDAVGKRDGGAMRQADSILRQLREYGASISREMVQKLPAGYSFRQDLESLDSLSVKSKKIQSEAIKAILALNELIEAGGDISEVKYVEFADVIGTYSEDKIIKHPLHVAVDAKNSAAVEALISYGVDVNCPCYGLYLKDSDGKHKENPDYMCAPLQRINKQPLESDLWHAGQVLQDVGAIGSARLNIKDAFKGFSIRGSSFVEFCLMANIGVMNGRSQAMTCPIYDAKVKGEKRHPKLTGVDAGILFEVLNPQENVTERVKKVKLLLAIGADPNEVLNIDEAEQKRGCLAATPMRYAVMLYKNALGRGDYKAMVEAYGLIKCLKSYGASITKKDVPEVPEGAPHYGLINGLLGEMASDVLSAGQIRKHINEINDKIEQGGALTPQELQYVAHPEIIFGAKTEAISNPVLVACKVNNKGALKQLLEAGAFVDSRFDAKTASDKRHLHMTPAMVCASKGDEYADLLAVLLSHGANVYRTQAGDKVRDLTKSTAHYESSLCMLKACEITSSRNAERSETLWSVAEQIRQFRELQQQQVQESQVQTAQGPRLKKRPSESMLDADEGEPPARRGKREVSFRPATLVRDGATTEALNMTLDELPDSPQGRGFGGFVS